MPWRTAATIGKREKPATSDAIENSTVLKQLGNIFHLYIEAIPCPRRQIKRAINTFRRLAYCPGVSHLQIYSDEICSLTGQGTEEIFPSINSPRSSAATRFAQSRRAVWSVSLICGVEACIAPCVMPKSIASSTAPL